MEQIADIIIKKLEKKAADLNVDPRLLINAVFLLGVNMDSADILTEAETFDKQIMNNYFHFKMQMTRRRLESEVKAAGSLKAIAAAQLLRPMTKRQLESNDKVNYYYWVWKDVIHSFNNKEEVYQHQLNDIDSACLEIRKLKRLLLVSITETVYSLCSEEMRMVSDTKLMNEFNYPVDFMLEALAA